MTFSWSAIVGLGLFAVGCGCGASSAQGTSSAPLVTHVASPSLLAVGWAHVYWAEQGGALRAATKSDGVVTDLVPGAHATALAADDARAYYATAEGLFAIDEPKGPSAPAPVLLAEIAGAHALALDAGIIYAAAGAKVFAVPTAGGEARVVAEAGADVSVLAADPKGVYFASGADVFLVGAGKLATASAAVRALVVDAAGPAWIAGDALTQREASGAERTIAQATLGDALVARGSELYFIDQPNGVVRVDLGAGRFTYEGTAGAGAIGLGASTVYFAVPAPDGEIGEVLQ